MFPNAFLRKFRSWKKTYRDRSSKWRRRELHSCPFINIVKRFLEMQLFIFRLLFCLFISRTAYRRRNILGPAQRWSKTTRETKATAGASWTGRPWPRWPRSARAPSPKPPGERATPTQDSFSTLPSRGCEWPGSSEGSPSQVGSASGPVLFPRSCRWAGRPKRGRTAPWPCTAQPGCSRLPGQALPSRLPAAAAATSGKRSKLSTRGSRRLGEGDRRRRQSRQRRGQRRGRSCARSEGRSTGRRPGTRRHPWAGLTLRSIRCWRCSRVRRRIRIRLVLRCPDKSFRCRVCAGWCRGRSGCRRSIAGSRSRGGWPSRWSAPSWKLK